MKVLYVVCKLFYDRIKPNQSPAIKLWCEVNNQDRLKRGGLSCAVHLGCESKMDQPQSVMIVNM